jgi:predicted P-loop ATPase
VNGLPLDEETAAAIRVEMRDLGHTSAVEFEDLYLADALENSFHPVKNYLESLVWDGADHILLLSKYLVDSDDPIVYPETADRPATARRVIYVWLKRWLVGAVAKTYGAGQNAMLVLNGAQNAGKSSFAKWLASPIPGMHCEEPIDPDSQLHNRMLASKWIWESGELASTTRRADVNALKSFLTKTECSFKIPYAKHLTTRQALASFVGTVNPDNLGYLVDTTGNRRYLSVNLESIDWAYRENIDIDQVWAQAYALFGRGEPWQPTAEEAKRRDELNQAHERADLVDDWIEKYFVIDPTNRDWKMTAADIARVLREFGGAKDGDRELATKIGIALGRHSLRRDVNQRPRCYVGIKPRLNPANQPA